MPEEITIVAIAATFLLAGTVKGVIGMGLPPISLALLTVVFGLPQAMALMIVPSLVTNIWQAATGGHGAVVLRRIWPFLAMATATVWLGAMALSRVDVALLSALLGLLLVVYGATGIGGMRLAVTPRHERWAGPALGAVNGVMTGMTGSFAVPGVMYLQAIGMPRDMLIQAMGMLFTVSTLALAAALHGNALLGSGQVVLSGAAVVPALLGMAFGRQIRRRLSESVFRRVFYAALLALGAYIVVRTLG
ncbi:MAG: sulfite exporter TauE/SafE family protein [Alphaproteobacteria bacterium]|jgi:uncharacterized membrane protein YfcA